uniref:Uncharacterized protein n=1 Tax=Aegilops tauschii subsp. strangulata TaxID=200361 RepID=A0A452XBT3_AEGTS
GSSFASLCTQARRGGCYVISERRTAVAIPRRRDVDQRPRPRRDEGSTHRRMELYCVPSEIPGFHECAGSRDGEGRRSSGSWRWAEIRGVLCALKLLAAGQRG